MIQSIDPESDDPNVQHVILKYEIFIKILYHFYL
jgi:hypothetical protein